MKYLLIVGMLFQFASAQAKPRDTRRIDLDMVNADIHNVIRLFADVSGLNFVVGDGVSGAVTIKLKRVRWPVALRAILKARQLEMVREGNVVRIVTRKDAQREREAQLSARDHCLRTAPLKTTLYRLSYAKPQTVATLFKGLISKRGKVMVDERTRSVIVRDVDCR